MARKTHDVLSVDWVRLELLRTAYSTRGGIFSRMDPRMVLLWYLILAIAPWFTHNLTVLLGLFGLGVVSVALARVGPLVLGLFVIGLGADVIGLFIAAFLFGGDLDTLVALAELNLKLGAVSMASMAAFVSLDPEKLSDALLSLRAPELLAFGVSYGYRMLPILVDEYVTVFEGQRLRHAPPQRRGILGWRVILQWCTLAVTAFYPIMLNTAKNVRTTVEALETRGFTYGAANPRGRSLRLAYLRVTPLDVAVVAASVLAVAAAFWLGVQFPLYR
ncbi:energy-coupling factor transporter transmembrane component T family protein [Brachybacterium muris]|uniref:Cobalt ABC transporter permease n=1 Tax=Brachybacterium muris UCD-AY4 TaxID=1249481 RepID=A0A022KXS6_9MICO|nr:energy-coupling factor transporter transmembrane component T [Brachybacterium muris]EYT49332.1 cobalt ABC transporter permease [Brachybacterium muris UCD-AY4]MCT1655525.1 energy-coupling factor transporter transmembrane protein EcfT [Brachybacterium muris]PZP13663.1 MAG: cobalt ABC transporter permease [Brachybacterium faecium]